MSTTMTTRPGAAGHPTRQQLDELDALLQRMLALPVGAADAEGAAPPREAPAPSRAPEPPVRSSRLVAAYETAPPARPPRPSTVLSSPRPVAPEPRPAPVVLPAVVAP